MKAFEYANRKFREAKSELTNAIEKDFPVGSTIFYDHGNYERHGEVTMHSDDRVRILTRLETQIWVDAYRIKRCHQGNS